MVMFYHLTVSRADETARTLLARSLQQGWRVMVRGTDPVRLAQLDEQLWHGPQDAFLPHGMAGGPHDADQPILLGTGPVFEGAQAVMVVDGGVIDPAEVAALERVFILFDGNNEDAVIAARGQWKTLTGAGHAAQYWSEASGRWEKKAG
jgi:DNA polymerase-3 subunit chi